MLLVVLLHKGHQSLTLLPVGGGGLVGAGWCVLSEYSAFIQWPPAIKQELHLNDFFPPLKAAVTGCYLLDLTLPAAFALF